MKTWNILYRIDGGRWQSMGSEKARSAATAIAKCAKHAKDETKDAKCFEIKAELPA